MTFFGLFFLSFVVALTGALSPGPLLTYTITKTLEREEGGRLVGLYVCLGHALLEGGLLVLLLVGLSYLLQLEAVVVVIGIVGGIILLAFAGLYWNDVFRKRITLEIATRGSTTQQTRNTVLGGILVSMSNPYWWIWWATIGLNLLVTNLVDVSTASGIVAFFLGHELGDVAWYLLISVLVTAGKTRINDKLYRGILAGCALFMAGLGQYFITSLLLPPPWTLVAPVLGCGGLVAFTGLYVHGYPPRIETADRDEDQKERRPAGPDPVGAGTTGKP